MFFPRALSVLINSHSSCPWFYIPWTIPSPQCVSGLAWALSSTLVCSDLRNGLKAVCIECSAKGFCQKGDCFAKHIKWLRLLWIILVWVTIHKFNYINVYQMNSSYTSAFLQQTHRHKTHRRHTVFLLFESNHVLQLDIYANFQLLAPKILSKMVTQLQVCSHIHIS